MQAKLVYDGGDQLYIPESMGQPKPNQLQGTILEQLGELACRICYDSLGVGRSSEELHKHILEVINLSVYEHCWFTLNIKDTISTDFPRALLNRKGVWFDVKDNVNQVTINFRAVLEWDKYTKGYNDTPFASKALGRILWTTARSLAPQIFHDRDIWGYAYDDLIKRCEITTELDENQAMITMYLSGSRGFSHEQVRHRFNISQRSTRYCDESESPWIEHPLITKFLNDKRQSGTEQMALESLINHAIDSGRDAYERCVEFLEAYLKEQGLGKTDARKQARGSGRGYLGNALETEMFFTAPVSAWRDIILPQRASKFADAEIRMIYNDVLPELKRSRYGHFFNDLELIDSPDGIGKVLA
jgi:thymidylate synthase ThyX